MTTITYCTTEITSYINKTKEEKMNDAIYAAAMTTNEAGDMTGFTVTEYTWDGREVYVCYERFSMPVAVDDRFHLIWEMAGLGWRILSVSGLTMNIVAPAAARYAFPEDAYF